MPPRGLDHGLCGSAEFWVQTPAEQTEAIRISEEHTGNIVQRRLLVNPYGPEIQTELCSFSTGKWPQFGKKNEVFTIYESLPDRYVPNSSFADRNAAIQGPHSCRPTKHPCIQILACQSQQLNPIPDCNSAWRKEDRKAAQKKKRQAWAASIRHLMWKPSAASSHKFGQKLSEQLPCRSAGVKFFSVFLCQRCREIWQRNFGELFRATFSRVWVCEGKFASKTARKTENFTQISLCWGVALKIALWHEIITKIIPWELFFVIFWGILCSRNVQERKTFWRNYAWDSSFSEKNYFRITIFVSNNFVSEMITSRDAKSASF